MSLRKFKDFARLTYKVRQAQRAYFASRNQENLRRAFALEQKLDDELNSLKDYFENEAKLIAEMNKEFDKTTNNE